MVFTAVETAKEKVSDFEDIAIKNIQIEGKCLGKTE
jgi:hypothetical protein